jgi:signal transduction histidine kinase
MATPPPEPAPPPRGGWSLARRLPLLISALLAVALGAFGAAAYYQVRAAAVERAADRLAGVAEQFAASSGSGGGQRTATLRALAADPRVVGALTAAGASGRAGVGAPPAQLAAAVAAHPTLRDSTLEGWELWTAAGARRASAGAPAGPADSLALVDARAAALRADTVRRSVLYHAGARVGVWTVLPVRAAGAAGPPLGVLAERRHLAVSPRAAQRIRQLTGEDVTVLLTSRTADGRLGAWVTAGGTPARAPFALPAPPRRGGAPAVAAVRDSAGGRWAVAQADVPGAPWVVVLAEREAAVLRRPHEFLRALVGAGLLALAGGAAAAWLLGRHVAGPLGAVTRAAEALAGGDYARRVDAAGAAGGGAEAARLAATFNAMAARVGEAHAGLAERNAALARANAAKVQFLAMMSHELRTPLNAIGGYTELLELGIRGPVTPEQVEDLARIRRSKDHLLSIITDLLSFARADAGHLTLALAPVPAAEVLAEARAALGHQFEARGVRLAVAPVPPAAVARADRQKLQQVVLNLLTNALRFTPPGGEVTVAAEAPAAEPGVVRLVVRDTGVGIPGDKLEAIFEPFVQVDATLTRRVGGTGLGLAIVRTLLAAMEGDVAVESTPGAGSTFTVTLPRAAEAPPADAPRPPAAPGAVSPGAVSPGAAAAPGVPAPR